MRSLVVIQERATPHEAEGQTNLESPEKHGLHNFSFFRKFFAISNDYSAGITAIATIFIVFANIGLAIITFFYLKATREYVGETRKQRELMQAQFVAANSPDI